MPRKLTASYSRLVNVMLMTLAVAGVCGCATTRPSEMHGSRVAVGALPPIGGIIPVFVDLLPPSSLDSYPIGTHPPQIKREYICAVKDGGSCVPALEPDNAAQMAGGADKLISITSSQDSETIIWTEMARSFVQAPGPTHWGKITGSGTLLHESRFGNQEPWQAIVGAAFLAGLKGAYLTLNENALQSHKINAASISDSTGGGFSNFDDGYVFFPIGAYRAVRFIVFYREGGFFQEAWTDTVDSPWPVSATNEIVPQRTEKGTKPR